MKADRCLFPNHGDAALIYHSCRRLGNEAESQSKIRLSMAPTDRSAAFLGASIKGVLYREKRHDSTRLHCQPSRILAPDCHANVIVLHKGRPSAARIYGFRLAGVAAQRQAKIR